MRERTRFAPSPTGPLHLGHVHAALFAATAARRSGGAFLVRIEDLDAGRCRPEWAEAALADLAWLGLRPDEPVRTQSAHGADYEDCLAALAARGLLYPCFCTRTTIRAEVAAAGGAPHDPDGTPRYPGTCRALSTAVRERRVAAGEPHALRLDMDRALRAAGGVDALSYRRADGTAVACDGRRFGDVVLGRKDAPCAYHLAVAHDDALADITLVTRAVDLAPATAVHRVLQALFAWPVPRYAFHPVLRDGDGRRLAKRDGARSLRSMREAGMSPDEVVRCAGFDPRSLPW